MEKILEIKFRNWRISLPYLCSFRNNKSFNKQNIMMLFNIKSLHHK